MICITVDGLNWITAKELYSNLFPKQTMKKILCNVRGFTDTPQGGQPTFVGLTCMWSGEKIKNFHQNLFARHDDNRPFQWLKRNGEPMDLVWDHFQKGKFQARYQGQNPYCNNEEFFKYNAELKNVKRCPTDELCIFSEIHKQDYDLFWHHSSIIKHGVFLPGPYEQGRVPSLIQYDETRKDKEFKQKVYLYGINVYKQVIRYIQDMTDEIIIISSDHGTKIYPPYTDNQVDEIPIIVNREVNMDNVNFQWDVKNFLLDMKQYDRKS